MHQHAARKREDWSSTPSSLMHFLGGPCIICQKNSLKTNRRRASFSGRDTINTGIRQESVPDHLALNNLESHHIPAFMVAQLDVNACRHKSSVCCRRLLQRPLRVIVADDSLTAASILAVEMQCLD